MTSGVAASAGDLDPRLRGWCERLASRTAQAADALTAVPGVTGLVLGGSVGRGQHWPLSDIDIIAVCADRPAEEYGRPRPATRSPPSG